VLPADVWLAKFRNIKSPKIEKPGICRAFYCKGSSLAHSAIAVFFGAAAWPCGRNDVKLVHFGRKRIWPMRRTGAKIRALIETGRQWGQFPLAGKGPARHSLKVSYWAPARRILLKGEVWW